MFVHLTDAEYLGEHRVRVSFNDGTKGEIDLSDSLDGPIFEPLRNVEFFQRFEIIGHTLAWPNGADFAPEFLHGLAKTATTA